VSVGKFLRRIFVKKLKKFLKGCFVAMSISALTALNSFGADIVMEMPGNYTFGPGTKTDGWYVLDGLELSQTAVAFGTVGSNIGMDASSTYYFEAWVVGIGATQTSINSFYHATGTFFREGTAAAVAIATGTSHRAERGTSDMEAWLNANVNGVDVRVVGSAATEIDWAAHVRYMKVTTDGT
jgi:hypothetical protein